VKKAPLKLTPTQLTLNPDLVFDDGSEVGDVKYKVNQPSWRRSDLYEVVAFATGFGAARAAIVGFGPSGSAEPPSLAVGAVAVRHFSWPSDPTVPPAEAAGVLCDALAGWLDEA
jgi:hypothetical protein